MEYESDWALGANCGIDNLDTIGKMIYLCNAKYEPLPPHNVVNDLPDEVYDAVHSI